MRFARFKTIALAGLDTQVINIEVTVLQGLPQFEIIGLGDSVIKEAKNRVRAAIKNSGFVFPLGRIIVSLTPAWIHKQGSAFDLAIALALLMASGQLTIQEKPRIVFGELSLNGQVNAVPGTYCRILQGFRLGTYDFLIPQRNQKDTYELRGKCHIQGVKDLKEAALACQDETFALLKSSLKNKLELPKEIEPDLQLSIYGQDEAVRALTIAIAGWHPLLMMGAPGSGKSSLIKICQALLPQLNQTEYEDLMGMRSALGLEKSAGESFWQRTFEKPHHTISEKAFFGGGQIPKPGSCSKAHGGILFLDEVIYFSKAILEGLQAVMDSGEVVIQRVWHVYRYPAHFLLLAACNPCTCGQYFERDGACHCGQHQVKRYLQKISGALWDRIDLQIPIFQVNDQAMLDMIKHKTKPHRISKIKQQIMGAREQCYWRCQQEQRQCIPNGLQRSPEQMIFFKVGEQEEKFLYEIVERYGESARGVHTIMRLARTIADLAAVEQVTTEHLAEAVQYRRLRQLLLER